MKILLTTSLLALCSCTTYKVNTNDYSYRGVHINYRLEVPEGNTQRVTPNRLSPNALFDTRELGFDNRQSNNQSIENSSIFKWAAGILLTLGALGNSNKNDV